VDPGHTGLELPQVLTAAEVAALYRVRVDTIYTWARDGRLPAVRMGNRLRFRRADVEALLAGGAA
jgi:excisionase family DNA binding protein